MRLTYRSEPLSELARLGLAHRLYVTGWELKDTYQWIRWTPTKQAKTTLIMAFYRGVPVGLVCAVGYGDRRSRKVETAFYVKPEYRRQGIGRKLTGRLRAELGPTNILMANTGIAGSATFLQRMKITIPLPD